jgi:hypothetical protein
MEPVFADVRVPDRKARAATVTVFIHHPKHELRFQPGVIKMSPVEGEADEIFLSPIF